MKAFSIYTFFIISCFQFVNAQLNPSEKCFRFIIQNVPDSAHFYLKKIEDKKLKNTFLHILENNFSYHELLYACESNSFYGKIQFKQLNRFLKRKIQSPLSDNNVNLDFVELKVFQISFIANELELKEANKENEALFAYLKRIKNKKDKNYRKAKLLAELHPALLKMIQNAPDGEAYTKKRERASFAIGDTVLALKFRDLGLNYLINKRDLLGYIDACEKSLAIEDKLKVKSPMFEFTISHLLDALIFKGSFDNSSVENLLFQLYQSPSNHYNSFTLYAKYIGHLPKNDPATKRIYNLFGVDNVGDFCLKLEREAKNKVNPNEYYYLLHECGVACFYQEDYKRCFYFNNNARYYNKKIYSEELSQTIADYQTREVEREKEFKILQEKQKSQLYLILTCVVLFFLAISVYLVVIYIRKSRILAIRNKEKEMLVNEINHRVKNNFQLVNSLLEMQSREIEDKEVLKKLNEGQSRIKSMSLIHQKLYQTEYLGLVNFQEYTEQLADLMLSIVQFDQVKTEINAHNIHLDIDTAIPLGLILNELFTNSLKYALSNQTGEFVKITIEQLNETTYSFSYADSGKGIQDQSQPAKGTGMGMRLIRSLVRQLQGELKYSNIETSTFSFTFKDKKGRKLID